MFWSGFQRRLRLPVAGHGELPPAEEIRDMCDDFARMCGYGLSGPDKGRQ